MYHYNLKFHKNKDYENILFKYLYSLICLHCSWLWSWCSRVWYMHIGRSGGGGVANVYWPWYMYFFMHLIMVVCPPPTPATNAYPFFLLVTTEVGHVRRHYPYPIMEMAKKLMTIFCFWRGKKVFPPPLLFQSWRGIAVCWHHLFDTGQKKRCQGQPHPPLSELFSGLAWHPPPPPTHTFWIHPWCRYAEWVSPPPAMSTG